MILTAEAVGTFFQIEKPLLRLSFAGLENICDLSDVTEASLLQTLRQRYKDRQIYTNVGRIVLSLNPFEYLPIYGEQTISQYMFSPDPYGLQPHVYQISAAALQNLKEGGKPQAALITGESGGELKACTFVGIVAMDHSPVRNKV